MNNATILYVVDIKTSDEAIRHAADCARDAGQYLRCLLHASPPMLPFNATSAMAYGGVPIADHWPQDVARIQDRLRERVREIEMLFGETGVSGEVTPMFCTLSDIKQQMVTCTRSADLVVLAENLRKTPEVFVECVHAGLFASPVGLLINAMGGEPADHVFLAWDDGDAASSAVHKGMPLLKASHKITIGCFDPILGESRAVTDPGADIAAWLTRHGCTVTLAHYPSGGVEIGMCILGKAGELGADLIFMGAYGHSRVRQAVFGGTTRTLLEQTGRPVFLGH
ncbi:MAG: universal stress protein [Pseudomonadota bacterium]